MWRRLFLPLSFLCIGSSSPMPDMTGVGQAAARMNDHTVELYFLLVMIAMQFIAAGVTAYRNGKTMERLAGAFDKVATSIQIGDAQAMANMAVIQHELGAAGRQREEIARKLRDFNRAAANRP
jgi:hypothetical protein